MISIKFELQLICLILYCSCKHHNKNTNSNVSKKVTSNIKTEKLLSIEAKPLPYPSYNLQEYLQTNIELPEDVKSKKVSGIVYVGFLVTINGDIQDVKLLKGIGHGCDEEAVRLISQMPRWSHVKSPHYNIKPERLSLPVKFKLDN